MSVFLFNSEESEISGFSFKTSCKNLRKYRTKKKKEISFVCFLFLASVVADTNFQ